MQGAEAAPAPATIVAAALARWTPDRPPLWLQNHPDLVSTVLPLLGSPDPDVRAKAAGVLGDVPPRSAAVVNALLPLLDDRVEIVRCNAMYGLGAQGDAGKAALVGLSRKVASGEGATRRSAILALGALGPRALASVPVLVDLLRRPPGDSQWDAVVALRHLRPPPSILPSYVDLVRRIVGKQGRSGAHDITLLELTAAIGDLGPGALPAENLLIELAAHQNGMTRATAAEALGRIPAQSSRSIATLIALLDQAIAPGIIEWNCVGRAPTTADLVRASAVEALGAAGAAAGKAGAALRRCAARDRYVRPRALAALERIRGAASGGRKPGTE